MMIKVIGIDPGLAATGIGIVCGGGLKVRNYSYDVIQSSERLSLPCRLDLIFNRFSEILAAETPDLMVMEQTFFLPDYPKSGLILGKVTGVLLLAGFRHNLPMVEIAVREAKKILTGNGKAGKAQLEKAVRHAIGAPERIRPFHASDALALALIGLFRHSRKLPGPDRTIRPVGAGG